MSAKGPITDDTLSYKCYLLNVRSHQEYICLEIDSCSRALEFSEAKEFSLDSSHVIVPVLDKIRFNIKFTDNTRKSWFRTKLEIYAENNQIYPKTYCSKCEELEKIKETHGNQSILKPESRHFSTNTDSVYTPRNIMETCTEISLEPNVSVATFVTATEKEVLTDEVSLKDSLLDFGMSRSEILPVASKDSIDFIKSYSLPELSSGNECAEKSAQTRVSLGNFDLSDISFELNNIEDTLNAGQELDEPLGKSLCTKIFKNPSVKSSQKCEATSLIHSSQHFKQFDVNNKIKYWSLINTARRVLKMNKDILELNSILKLLEIQKAMDNPNIISSLSPTQSILKHKGLNQSSRIYSLLNNYPDVRKLNAKEAIKSFGFDTKLIYLYHLNKTFLNFPVNLKDQSSKRGSINIEDIDKQKKDSLLNMESLFSMQKHMLRTMGTFLRRNDRKQFQ